VYRAAYSISLFHVRQADKTDRSTARFVPEVRLYACVGIETGEDKVLLNMSCHTRVRDMAQAVSRRPLTTEARVRSQVKSM
jgi:hypothetical protein